MKPIYDILQRELGAAKVLRDEARLETYARDESGLGPYPPEAAVLADSVEEIQLVLRLADEHDVVVVPRGLGTGMTGGALPIHGGIVLSTERMQKIKEISREDLVAVVEPGVITGVLQDAVEAEGLFYPPDPASLAMCSLGGNVAENAGGPRAFKYGVTREYLIGMECVLMGGTRLRPGRRTSKGVTGYDVVGLFCGSEGTFGVTSEITFKLLPKPQGVALLLAVFADPVRAGEAVSAIIRQGYRPRALEFMDRVSIEHVRPKATYPIPEGAGAVVICELDGDADVLDGAVERCAQACDALGAVEVIIAADEAQRRKLWETRRITSPSLRHAHRYKVSEDICVPRSAIAEMLRRVDTIGAQTDLLMATFGHAGDGNLHVNVLTDEDHHDARVAARIQDALGMLFKDTLALRGTLSGEHGIGIAKKKYMPWEQAPELIDLQKKLKRTLDPKNLLNPGKIFPE